MSVLVVVVVQSLLLPPLVVLLVVPQLLPLLLRKRRKSPRKKVMMIWVSVCLIRSSSHLDDLLDFHTRTIRSSQSSSSPYRRHGDYGM
ncbi:hypothetical protein EJD97_015756 [Solanum chilense]|uniref:Uncharacterized protein n=1 Tax=Solanum chilense TaxID=4083 RepID=A0A6N2CAF6_SOLCI|nr:hypothetical protein EJD97_015756 [Solanum chilense]